MNYSHARTPYPLPREPEMYPVSGFEGEDYPAAHYPQPPPEPFAGSQVCMASGGEQENWAHRGVREDRYPGERGAREQAIKSEPYGVEPYSRSLYQTPYDATKNLISTGTLVNSYTREIHETFENQLPPPNTTKGVIPAYQLKQPNTRLLHSQGGFNHHNPPPRKKEQPGYVFNPVSARGGSNPFGDATYSNKILARLKEQASRDIFNNRNGDQVVIPSMNGERPKNKFGLVDRVRYMPYVPPTNELDRRGWVSIPEDQNTNLTKREQYTGQWFKRKDPVLVTRDVYPNTFVNGIEAISWIPINSEHSGPQRSDQEQRYIPPWAPQQGHQHRHAAADKAQQDTAVCRRDHTDGGIQQGRGRQGCCGDRQPSQADTETRARLAHWPRQGAQLGRAGGGQAAPTRLEGGPGRQPVPDGGGAGVGGQRLRAHRPGGADTGVPREARAGRLQHGHGGAGSLPCEERRADVATPRRLPAALRAEHVLCYRGGQRDLDARGAATDAQHPLDKGRDIPRVVAQHAEPGGRQPHALPACAQDATLHQ